MTKAEEWEQLYNKILRGIELVDEVLVLHFQDGMDLHVKATTTFRQSTEGFIKADHKIKTKITKPDLDNTNLDSFT